MTSELAGSWRVERVSGVLPPLLRKRIGTETGWTALGRLPLAPFRVRGGKLDYVLLPVRDELVEGEHGEWLGRGLVLGKEFCRFRLVREPDS